MVFTRRTRSSKKVAEEPVAEAMEADVVAQPPKKKRKTKKKAKKVVAKVKDNMCLKMVVSRRSQSFMIPMGIYRIHYRVYDDI